jgi:predicted RecA/RadA family phage recombinase
MAKNYSYPGKSVDYKNTGESAIHSGNVVVMGTLVGVAHTDINPGKVGAVAVTEVWKLPKADGTAFALGDAAFLDTANKVVAAAAAEGVIAAGTVFADAAAGAAVVLVKLNS